MIYVILVLATVAVSAIALIAVRLRHRADRLVSSRGAEKLPAPPKTLPLPETSTEVIFSTAPPAIVSVDRSAAGGASARTEPAATSLAAEPRPAADDQSRSSGSRSTRDIANLRLGLAATRGGFIAKLASIFQGKKQIDPAILEQMEEVMLASDIGPKTTRAILDRLRNELDRDALRDVESVWRALREEAVRILSVGGGPIRLSTKPSVVLMVGVNGTGKTTTIGKLATRFRTAGNKVLLAAGDTFRAAAVQQLEVWGTRVGVDVVKGKEGADPGAVAFDATTRAKRVGTELLLLIQPAASTRVSADGRDQEGSQNHRQGDGRRPTGDLSGPRCDDGQNAHRAGSHVRDAVDSRASSSPSSMERQRAG